MKYFIPLLFLFFSCSTPESNSQSDETLLNSVNDLSQYLVTPDSLALEKLVHSQLTYGHSTGLIETKDQFIGNLFDGVDVINWNVSEIQNERVGNTAWVRHNLEADLTSGTDTTHISLKVLMVWVNEKGEWKLLARQAVKQNK